MIRLDDLPEETTPQPRAATGLTGYAVDRSLGRRRLIKQAGRLGAALGVASLGVFKVTREQAAQAAPWPPPVDGGPPYNFWNTCGIYDPDNYYDSQALDNNQNGFYDPPGAGGTCSDDACVGALAGDIAMGWDYCVQCSEVGGQNVFWYHFIGVRGSYHYGDRTDICDPMDNQTSRDYWWWDISNCGYCGVASFNCHDGYKMNSSTGDWTTTICQALRKCNGVNYTC